MASISDAGARLRITEEALAGYIPRWCGIGLRGSAVGEWRCPWSAVRRVRLNRPRWARHPVTGLGEWRLAIETDQGTFQLRPFLWVDPKGADHRLALGELFSVRRRDLTERLEAAPLLKAVRARGFAIESDVATASSRQRFDLARHTGMRVQLLVLAVAGGYALVDGLFLGPYRPLQLPPLWPFAAAAAAGVLVMTVLGRGAPRVERLVVGAFAVAALTAAVYPSLLRINAATGSFRMVEYTAIAPGRFEDVTQRRPPIDLSDHDLAAYWTAHGPGTRHRFRLVRGAPGFHQVDLMHFYEQTRAFYARRSEP